MLSQGVCLGPSHRSWPPLEFWVMWASFWSTYTNQGFVLFLKDFISLFLEGGEKREKESTKNINVWLPLTCPALGTWPTTQACALTGNRTSNTLVLRSALNQLSHSSQGGLVLLLKSYRLRLCCCADRTSTHHHDFCPTGHLKLCHFGQISEKLPEFELLLKEGGQCW